MNYLVEIKNEYTTQLINIITPLINEGIQSIYDDSLKVSRENEELKVFQNFLKKIPKWNTHIILNETKRILIESNNRDLLLKLLNAVIKSNINILSNTLSEKNKVIIPKTITFELFIHNVYIETAKLIYNNPYLYFHKYSSFDIKKHQRESIENIKLAIHEAIRKLLPLKSILNEYLDNSNIDKFVAPYVLKHVSDNKHVSEKKHVPNTKTSEYIHISQKISDSSSDKSSSSSSSSSSSRANSVKELSINATGHVLLNEMASNELQEKRTEIMTSEKITERIASEKKIEKITSIASYNELPENEPKSISHISDNHKTENAIINLQNSDIESISYYKTPNILESFSNKSNIFIKNENKLLKNNSDTKITQESIQSIKNIKTDKFVNKYYNL
jgi:hypothetical protein